MGYFYFFSLWIVSHVMPILKPAIEEQVLIGMVCLILASVPPSYLTFLAAFSVCCSKPQLPVMFKLGIGRLFNNCNLPARPKLETRNWSLFPTMKLQFESTKIPQFGRNGQLWFPFLCQTERTAPSRSRGREREGKGSTMLRQLDCFLSQPIDGHKVWTTPECV